jgi:hypothetical protein
MEQKTLPGIFKIEYLPAEELVLYPKLILSPGVRISAIGNFIELPLNNLASRVVATERTKQGLVYTTTIEGNATECLQLTDYIQHQLSEKHHVFRITDIYKQIYLVGTDKKPFPEINFAPSIESTPDGKRSIDFQIQYIATIPLIEILPL